MLLIKNIRPTEKLLNTNQHSTWCYHKKPKKSSDDFFQDMLEKEIERRKK